MATNADQGLKRLRELLPENGKDTPDEFILEILQSCDNDLTKAFEELQERLARASWESVEGKKKKSDRTQSAQQTSSYARRRVPSGRSDSKGGNSWEHNKESYSSGNRPKGTLQTRPQPNSTGSGRNPSRPNTTDASAISRPPVNDGEKAAPANAPQDRPAPLPPAPHTNQWAKGRPQVDPPKEKERAAPALVAPTPSIAPEQKPVDSTVVDENAANNHNTSDSASLGSTEPSEHNGGADFADGTDELSSPHIVEQPAQPVASEVVDHSHRDSDGQERSAVPPSLSEESVITSDFERFSVSSAPKGSDAAQQPSAGGYGSSEALPSAHYSRPQEDGQGFAQTPYSQYSGYQQNYQSLPQQHQQAAPQYDPSHESQSTFNNAGKMYYMGAGEGGYPVPGQEATSIPHRPPQPAYGGKGNFGHKGQPQQQGWQAPVMNSYGMMGANMYAMTPQQLQMMYMQSFGMGMPYAPGAMNGQLLNGGAGFAQQNFGSGSKAGFHQQSANKKHQQYGGGFSGATQYDSLPNPQQASYPQQGAASEEFFKGQGSAAGNYDGSFGYQYAGGMNFDGGMSSFQGSQQQGAQGYGNGRCSTLAAGMGGGAPAEEAPYWNQRRPYFSQPEHGQGSGQWIGGN